MQLFLIINYFDISLNVKCFYVVVYTYTSYYSQHVIVLRNRSEIKKHIKKLFSGNIK